MKPDNQSQQQTFDREDMINFAIWCRTGSVLGGVVNEAALDNFLFLQNAFLSQIFPAKENPDKADIAAEEEPDHSPVEKTCPKISRVVQWINESVQDLGYIQEDEEKLEQSHKSILLTLDEIKQANAGLRAWGNQQFQRAEHLQKHVDGIRKVALSSADLNKAFLEHLQVKGLH